VGDDRDLGVKVTGLAADGAEIWEDTQFADGCHTHLARGWGAELLCWTAGHAEIRIPVPIGADVPDEIEIELSAEREKTVELTAGGAVIQARVTEAPVWVTVPLVGPTYDVINNVGSRLVRGGYGGDRGFLERDAGQYAAPEEVFAWCGGAVLLSTRYLRDVGIFDDRYFMYYEDTDLAWRGRLAGWRYCYVPESVVRHEHAASSKEGSSLFMHYVERNRFLTLARNAPWSMFTEASYVYLRDTAVIFDRDVVRRLLHRARPAPGFTLRRVRAYAAFVKLLPETLRTRRAQAVSATERAEVVERWSVSR
jgi:hypothetical protein